MANELKDIVDGLVEFYTDLGYSKEEAEAKAMQEAPGVIERGAGKEMTSSREMASSGGRIGFQEGGQTYQQIVDEIMASYPAGADAQEISRPSPQVEALQNIFGPQLASFLGTPISPGTGGENLFGDQYGAFTPQAQAQNVIQQQAINQALQQAGLGAEDINLVELHDCFATAEMLHYENLGLCNDGEAGQLIDGGHVELGGKIPVNVSGGLLSKGHPLGATGIANIYEVCTHLRGEAGKRQVEGARVGMTHVIGLGTACGIHILEKV